MKVAEYVSTFLSLHTSGRVYMVSGGGAMWLNDAIFHHPGLTVTCMHHEQACAYAAEADARVSNMPSVVHVTAGPGVTNAMTGVACAYADSIPMIVIAGQVETRTMLPKRWNDPRQLGIAEVDGSRLMKPITKMSVTVDHGISIRYMLEKALHLATSGRKGPVFLEIPLDIQNEEIDEEQMAGFTPVNLLNSNSEVTQAAAKVIQLLQKAERPVILIGNGCRLAGAEREVSELLTLGAPILCSWSAADMLDANDCFGRPGLIGDRAGNFAISNADLIIAVGTRLSIPQIGHAYELFAKDAKLVVVDIDATEVEKPTIRPHLGIVSDAKQFLQELLLFRPDRKKHSSWRTVCAGWQSRHPVRGNPSPKTGVDVYEFLHQLAKDMADDSIVVTDVGQTFVCTMQALPQTGKRRTFHSPGIAPMGYGLPGSVGAYLAGGGRQTICITGDGGTMFNLQELATIVANKLPIKIFLYDNDGYRTMQVTQGTHFKRESGASWASGLAWPHYGAVAKAFGIDSLTMEDHRDFNVIRQALKYPGPILVRVIVDPDFTIAPLVKTKMKDGKFVPTSLSEMYPPLVSPPHEEVIPIF